MRIHDLQTAEHCLDSSIQAENIPSVFKIYRLRCVQESCTKIKFSISVKIILLIFIINDK